MLKKEKRIAGGIRKQIYFQEKYFDLHIRGGSRY